MDQTARIELAAKVLGSHWALHCPSGSISFRLLCSDLQMQASGIIVTVKSGAFLRSSHFLMLLRKHWFAFLPQMWKPFLCLFVLIISLLEFLLNNHSDPRPAFAHHLTTHPLFNTYHTLLHLSLFLIMGLLVAVCLHFLLFPQANVFAPGPPESSLPPAMSTSLHVGPGKSKHSTPQFGALHAHPARMKVAPSWPFLSSFN